jgi:hypothetical protein
MGGATVSPFRGVGDRGEQEMKLDDLRRPGWRGLALAVALTATAAGAAAQLPSFLGAGQVESHPAAFASPVRLTGTVRRGGKPVAGYMVVAALRDGTGGTVARAVSGADGAYVLNLSIAGEYSLSLGAPTHSSFPRRQTLTVQEGDEPTQDFDLNAASLRGRVVDQGGAPVPRAIVALKVHDASAAWVISDAQGRFDVAFEGAGAAAVTAMRAGYTDGAPVAFQLADESAVPPPVTLVLTRKAVLHGTVLKADGTPLAKAHVATSSAATYNSVTETRTGATGHFKLAVPPAPAYLFVTGPGCPLFAAPLPPQQPAGADPAEPAADSPNPLLHCPAQSGNLALTLLADDGKPAPPRILGFALRHDGLLVPATILRHLLELQGLPKTPDTAGYLLLASLSPGRYDLLDEHAPPDGPALASITVEPGTTAPLTVTLPTKSRHLP